KAESPPIPKPTGPAKKKLSYKEQQELDGMQQTIEKAEAVAHAHEAVVNNPATATDHKKMADACKKHAEAQPKVARLYARWADLE
ncbi:MAG: ABC transporter C-terminal domain-containing protein, partial [Planctomycetota bacterium]